MAITTTEINDQRAVAYLKWLQKSHGDERADALLTQLKSLRGEKRRPVMLDVREYAVYAMNYHEEHPRLPCPNCGGTYTLIFSRPPRSEAEAEERRQRVQFPQLCPPCRCGFIPLRQSLIQNTPKEMTHAEETN